MVLIIDWAEKGFMVAHGAFFCPGRHLIARQGGPRTGLQTHGGQTAYIGLASGTALT